VKEGIASLLADFIAGHTQADRINLCSSLIELQPFCKVNGLLKDFVASCSDIEKKDTSPKYELLDKALHESSLIPNSQVLVLIPNKSNHTGLRLVPFSDIKINRAIHRFKYLTERPVNLEEVREISAIKKPSAHAPK
jgi:hypothetical protein